MSTNAACRSFSRFCTRPLKTLPTSRSSSGCSTTNSSRRPFSIMATRVSRRSTFMMISRFIFERLSHPNRFIMSVVPLCVLLRFE